LSFRMIPLLVTLFAWLLETVVSDKTLDQRTNVESPVFAWVYRLILNSLGYFVVFIPLLVFRACLSRSDRMDGMLSSKLLCLPACIRTCFVPDVQDSGLPLPVTSGAPLHKLVNVRMAAWFNRAQSLFGLNVEAGMRTSKQHYTLLTFCVVGLQFSYVLWGIMQERIMTRDYDGMMFGNSQFLVFCNRLTTLFVVVPIHLLPLGILANPLQPGRRAPLFEFSYASISNILSSWCQYEALKYVSFPTQASVLIP
ncbi:solute carrier family 35 (adenosine 3'-phospho 5'-phosphosulfate transporter), member B2, partial [Paragonimus westermani]